MTKVKTLFKKGYLLAGVIMAASMFIVNEVNATDDEYIIENDEQKDNKNFPFIRILNTASGFVLYWENTINLATGLVVSGANNYFKWWNYNPGRYGKFGCYGWRSGSFIKDIFQFDINLNIGRGILWLIATFFGNYKCFNGGEDPKGLRATAAVFINAWKKQMKYDLVDKILFFFFSCVQGFVSAPLAIQISNFSIAVSIDSIIWASIRGLSTIVRERRVISQEEIPIYFQPNENNTNNKINNFLKDN